MAAIAALAIAPCALGARTGAGTLHPARAATVPSGYRLLGELAGGLRILASDNTDPDERPEDWKLLVGVKPALTQSVCDEVIQTVQAPDFDWTTSRHALFPTTDTPVFALPWLEQEMDAALRASILPGFASLFGINEAELVSLHRTCPHACNIYW